MRSRDTILNNAWPSRVPLCALFSWVKPNRADWSCHLPFCSSIHEPVTARYPSQLEACHASHVKLTFPFTFSLWSTGQNDNRDNAGTLRTFNLSRSAVNCCLNVLMMASRVWRRSGILTPFVARAATWIMFWNVGCSKAWIGWNTYHKLVLDSRTGRFNIPDP